MACWNFRREHLSAPDIKSDQFRPIPTFAPNAINQNFFRNADSTGLQLEAVKEIPTPFARAYIKIIMSLQALFCYF